MDTTPPFSPPYKTFEQTPEGLRVIETLTDGTTRIVPADETARLARRWQSSAPRSAVRKVAAAPSGTAASKAPLQPLAQGNGRVVMYLNVPFAEKDEAKLLGAKWDAGMRKWYVPHGVDAHQFNRWWPDTLEQEKKSFGRH